MLSLVKEYDLPYEFPEPVIKEAKKISQEIDEKDIVNRKDLRDEEIFTIDGEDAKDLDDAVNVKKLAKWKLYFRSSHRRCKPLCKRRFFFR